MSMSNYAEPITLNYWLNATAGTPPANLYLALYTTDPTDADTGTEVSTGGYTRQTIDFNTATDGTTENNGAVAFTASGASFGTVTHFAVRDASTAGNMIVHGALTTSREVVDGATLTFPDATGIVVTID